MERPRTRESVMQAVCDRIESGELVDEAAAAEGTTRKTIWKWAREVPSLGYLYAQARERSAEALELEAIRVARSVNPFPRHFDARLLVDTLKWAAAKRRPREYSDRVEYVMLGKTPSEMTDDELAAESQRVRSKLRLVS